MEAEQRLGGKCLIRKLDDMHVLPAEWNDRLEGRPPIVSFSIVFIEMRCCRDDISGFVRHNHTLHVGASLYEPAAADLVGCSNPRAGDILTPDINRVDDNIAVL